MCSSVFSKNADKHPPGFEVISRRATWPAGMQPGIFEKRNSPRVREKKTPHVEEMVITVILRSCALRVDWLRGWLTEGKRMRPLILIDVDGVLNPSFSVETRRRLQYHEGWITRKASPHGIEFRLFLNPLHGKWLKDLAAATGAELAWGTTWEKFANQHVGPHLGLPGLPFVSFAGCRHKAQGIVPWTSGRPFVWFDDEPDAGPVTAKLAGDQPHKVIWVSERTGLTREHITCARDWLMKQAPEV